MSKQIYDETQAFLEDKWGPLGGWAQAVMFAADLKASTTARTTPVKERRGRIEVGSPCNKVLPKYSPLLHETTTTFSPLKRKSEGRDFRRTRSATRLTTREADSILFADNEPFQP